MAYDYWQQVATCPTGYGYGNPFVANVGVPPGPVAEVRCRVPPGPAGTFGFALGMAGNQVFPSHGQNFIIADDETFTYVPPNSLTSGAWQVLMVNDGTYPHSVYLTFVLLVDERASAVTGGVTLDLSGVQV